jgi:hypothetical protein
VSIPGLAFIDDGAVLGEEGNDRIDVTFGLELEVALDDVGDVVERGLLVRLAMLPARTLRHQRRDPTRGRGRRRDCDRHRKRKTLWHRYI